MNFRQKLSWKFLLPIGIALWSSFAWSYLLESFIGFLLALIGFVMTLAGTVDLIKQCKKNTKNIPLLLLFILIFLILFLAPWMTDNWCKEKLIYSKEIDTSWSVSAEWIPFGRRVDASRPKPHTEVFSFFMNIFGKTIGEPTIYGGFGGYPSSEESL